MTHQITTELSLLLTLWAIIVELYVERIFRKVNAIFQKNFEKLYLTEWCRHGKTGWILFLTGITTRNRARTFAYLDV